ncbi:MAG: hypothetical protein Q7R66_07805 [Undibacterium sp.]|uniref:hypothetical protein n=1 Tax=Undibacterium sp. TaxID=1914977 RepID=UPI00272263A9|nr:hypothetical protein [Undibacterium sp.]MDO8652078.1 hypothetical protein [Undibacterium sp.]
MARLLIQSMNTGHFLTCSQEGGEPVWTTCLRDAGGGVVADMESAVQLFEDNCEPEDQAIVIDLDRLGTKNDYLPR